MITVTCDRCGEKIADVDYDMTSINVNGSKLDLCQKCQNKLNFVVQKFIRGEEIVVKALDRERR